MALHQQKFREIVLQLLYSQDLGHPDEASMIELIMAELTVSKRNVRLALQRVEKIKENLPKIDHLIESFSTSYNFNRIQIVTKNILRLGAFELLFDDNIPPKVAIAEAIRLSRKFANPESASFVNAILDQIYRQSQGIAIDSNEIHRLSQQLMQQEIIDAEKGQQQMIQEDSSDEQPSDF